MLAGCGLHVRPFIDGYGHMLFSFSVSVSASDPAATGPALYYPMQQQQWEQIPSSLLSQPPITVEPLNAQVLHCNEPD